MKTDFSKVKWNLLVESAKAWIEREASSMEGDEAGDAEGAGHAGVVGWSGCRANRIDGGARSLGEHGGCASFEALGGAQCRLAT